MTQRQRLILDMLTGGREVSVRELAEHFDVAQMTIRRDLSTLEQEGRVLRTHGGAVLSRPGTIEFRFQQRTEKMSAEKTAIAGAAAAMVSPGMAVCLDTGTTTLAVAGTISGMCDLTVLTTSLAVAARLYHRENLQLVLLGGQVRKNSPDLFGELTISNLERFRSRIAFLGADSASPDGLFTTDPSVAGVSRAIMEGAERCVLVADSSKFSATAFVKYAEWKDIDAVITDSGIPADCRGWLRKRVDTLTIVEPVREG